MTEPQPDREFLLSIFLMEAWDTVSILEEGAPGLSSGGDVEPLLVVAHRLRGAAALHALAEAALVDRAVGRGRQGDDPRHVAVRDRRAQQRIRLRLQGHGLASRQRTP